MIYSCYKEVKPSFEYIGMFLLITGPFLCLDLTVIHDFVKSHISIDRGLYKEEEIFKESIKTLKAKYKV